MGSQALDQPFLGRQLLGRAMQICHFDSLKMPTRRCVWLDTVLQHLLHLTIAIIWTRG